MRNEFLQNAKFFELTKINILLWKCVIYWTEKRIKGGWEYLVLFVFQIVNQLLYVFCKMLFAMFSGKLMGAASVFWQGATSANLEEDDVLVSTVAFFVVVVLLLSLDAMFSFQRYRHSNNKNEIKWLKNTKEIVSRFSTLCVLEKPIPWYFLCTLGLDD